MGPLAKRFPRELKNNLGKYLAIFMLMAASIALTSGFLLAAHSISVIIDGMGKAYAIEDGRFTTSFEATGAQLDAARAAAKKAGHAVRIYPNFSIDAAIAKAHGDDGTKRTLRVRTMTRDNDRSAYAQGRKPKAADEVAVDRVFATNNDLGPGDTVKLHGRAYRIVGIMTQPDSQALFLDNSDFTVNTVTYGVGELTAAGFAALEDAGAAPAYTYSFAFGGDPTVAERTSAEKDMVRALGSALGVAVFTEPMRGLYYGSYSLPPFHVSWDWGIFIKTAVVPVAVLVAITLLGLLRKMNLTPLQFLRHETSGRAGAKRGFTLPERLGFTARFRLRVFLRNLGNFATLFLGIAFASLLLLFGLAVLPTMTHYAGNLRNTLVAERQYTLKAPLELAGTDAQREAWAAADKLQGVDAAELSAAQDAAKALGDAGDAARRAAAGLDVRGRYRGGARCRRGRDRRPGRLPCQDRCRGGGSRYESRRHDRPGPQGRGHRLGR